jgi:hypothetical protein
LAGRTIAQGQGLFSPSRKRRSAESKSGRGVVDQRPSGAGDQAGLDGLFGRRAARFVEGACGAHEILAIFNAGMPYHFFAVNRYGNGKIFRRKAAAGIGG